MAARPKASIDTLQMHFASRIRRLRTTLARLDHDAFLIANPADIRYLTGFSGEASCLIVLPKRLILISDSRFEEELAPFGHALDIVMRQTPMPEAQKKLLAELKPGSLAVQAEHLSVETRGQLAKAIGAKHLRDTSGILAHQRMIKDESEVALIRRAIKIQQEAMLELRPTIRPGQAESAIAARLEYEMRLRGAEGTSFPSIVAARSNGSKPHYRAGAIKTARNQPLLIDWGARRDSYCSDMTRTFVLGRWPKQIAEIYKIVLEAHESAITAARPGMTCAELDLVARGIIDRAGYGPRFGHGLGHGIGIDIHENPRIFKSVDLKLEAGMVVTIEPGIYLPGIGGVRIEDDILITGRSAKNLCSLPKDITWATLDG